jgi:hypothetical protein
MELQEATHQRTNGAPDLATLYPSYNLSVPIDHFHNDSSYEPHSNATFPLRYWFDKRFYQSGGPVILLAGGETNGADRLSFLQKGILAILAEATGGLGVILEHRYYGKSFPFENLTTESLRFLTTDQALADAAYFARNAKFPDLEDVDLTAPGTAYIAYGGSYAGALVAFLRKLYPETFWGAISSSGVTAAIYDYWEYYEAARLFAPGDCAATTQKLIRVVDNILLGTDDETKKALKRAFGLGNLTNDVDFAEVLSDNVAGLQSTNWDPEVSSPHFGYYCGNLSSSEILYPNTEVLNTTARELLVAGGYEGELDTLINTTLNYIGFTNATTVSKCNETIQKCFSGHDLEFFARDDINQTWRSWSYQVCTQ